MGVFGDHDATHFLNFLSHIRIGVPLLLFLKTVHRELHANIEFGKEISFVTKCTGRSHFECETKMRITYKRSDTFSRPNWYCRLFVDAVNCTNGTE